MSFWSTCRFLPGNNLYPFSIFKSPWMCLERVTFFFKILLYDWIILQRKGKISVYLVLKNMSVIYYSEIHRLCFCWHFVYNLFSFFFLDSWLWSDLCFKILYVESNDYKSACIWGQGCKDFKNWNLFLMF